MPRIFVKNWKQFQHYGARKSPPWIKFHRTLLDDPEWWSLNDASRALAPMLWLLASESEDGSFNSSASYLSFRLRMNESALVAAYKPLMDNGFFTGNLESASTTLAPCYQLASAELDKELDKEKEEDLESTSLRSVLVNISPAAAVAKWRASSDAVNAVAYWAHQTTTVVRSSSVLKSYHRRADDRLKEGCTLDDLKRAVDTSLKDPYYVQRGYFKRIAIIWLDFGRVQQLAAWQSAGTGQTSFLDTMAAAARMPPIPEPGAQTNGRVPDQKRFGAHDSHGPTQQASNRRRS